MVHIHIKKLCKAYTIIEKIRFFQQLSYTLKKNEIFAQIFFECF